LLDHPWISTKKFVNKDSGEINVSTQFTWPVWDYDQERIRLISQGKSVFKQIATAVDTWPNGESMPSLFDVVIKRTGTGKNDTEYTVQAIPYSGIMPPFHASDLPNMAEKTGGISIQQMLKGEKPPVLLSPGASEPEPSNPTHDDAAALEAEITAKMSDDVVLTDIDDKKPINLEDIPF
jgi:hypothetical protein